MKDLSLERRIKSSLWMVKSRWFTISGILVIGILAEAIGEFNFPYKWSITLAVIMYLANFIFYLGAKTAAKQQSSRINSINSFIQIILDLLVITFVYYLAGALESTVDGFFLLPIITASMLFGFRGPVYAGLAAVVLSNALIALEFAGILPHRSPYGVEALEYTNFYIALTKIISANLIYIIVGFSSGFMARQLTGREKALSKSNLELQNSNKKVKKAYMDLMKVEARLLEERNRVAAVINNFIDPILVLDVNDKINLYNPAAKNKLGLDENKLDKIIKADDNYSLNNFSSLITRPHQVKTSHDLKGENNIEEIVVTINDQETTYKVTTVKIYNADNKYFGTMKIFYNLTREKVLDRLKSEFISIVAHQLRTPLSAIKWSTKIVLDEEEGKLNKGQKDILWKSYLSNERVIKLVNDMLNVSRIEEGRFGYNFEKISIGEPLRLAIDSLKDKVELKKLKIIFEMPDNIEKVYIDKQKMHMVFQNLLENAVSYTPESGNIYVKVKKQAPWLNISVKDNGIGIPAEQQKKLFNKFFRASNASRIKTDGSGLGLFIAKNIINKHTGKISFTSKEGMGTEFVVSLPLEQSN